MSDPTVLNIDTFTLTLFFPDEQGSPSAVDRLELYDITQAHVQDSLVAELVGVTIERVTLTMETALTMAQTTEDSTSAATTWTELVSGSVKFAQPAPIPSATLQTLVEESFQNDALDLFEIRLKLAQDEGLQKIDRVSVGLDTPPQPPNGDTINPNDENGSSTLLIVIVVCVVLGVIMACVFAYCLLYGRKRRRTKQHKDRELPGITTDPTPPDETAAGGVEYYSQEGEYYQETPDDIPDPYLLNAAESSDAGSSLQVDSDTVTDVENQSLAPSLYSYREEASTAPKKHQAPSNEMSLQKLPRQMQAPATTTMSGVGSPSRKGGAMVGGGFLGGLMGKYMGTAATNNNNNVDEGSHGEDEYGFDKEANPKELMSGLSMDDGSVFIKVDDFDDNRSLVSDGRVGQILGDVRSIQGQESPHNFDEIWNDEESDGDDDDNNTSSQKGEEDISQVLNASRGTLKPIPLEDRISSSESRPFDEQRIEQRDIIITPRTAAPVPSGASVGVATGGMAAVAVVAAGAHEDSEDDVSQIVMDDGEESVQDYGHHQLSPAQQEDDSTQGSCNGEEASIAEDSYGFVYQKHYHAKPKPLVMPAPSKGNNGSVNLSLPQNLKQRSMVDQVPGSGVTVESGPDDESVEVSVNSKTSSKSKASTKSGLSSSIKAMTPRKLVKGMSVRKKRASDWGGESPTKAVPRVSSPVAVSPENSRPTSPSPSVGSSDSAKFRALMSEPDVYDAIPPTESKTGPGNNYLKNPASLFQNMPSDSDDDDCYIDDDQPVVAYPSSILTPEEKKEDSSVVFSLDA